MRKVIHCDCGHVVQAETDDELVAEAQKHARDVHNMEISRDQVFAMATPDVGPGAAG